MDEWYREYARNIIIRAKLLGLRYEIVWSYYTDKEIKQYLKWKQIKTYIKEEEPNITLDILRESAEKMHMRMKGESI